MIFSILAMLCVLAPAIARKPSCQKACRELAENLPDAVFLGPSAKADLWSFFQTETQPECRVQPSTASEVAEILTVARTHHCHFAVLAGGTSPFRNASTAHHGITIDLRRMNNVSVNAVNEQVKVDGGATWADVYLELEPLNMSATGTRNSFNGVTGSILGGGISFFSQRHGWSCDTVVNFEVVLANSSIVNVSQESHSELFFALRGGGNNFGIVTSVTLETFKPPSLWHYSFQLWDMNALKVIFQQLQETTQSMPPEIWQTSVTLSWHIPKQQWVVSERTVSSEPLDSPRSSMLANGTNLVIKGPRPLETYVFQYTTLQMAQKMGQMNKPGFYNYFGSVTVKNDFKIYLVLADIFRDEVAAVSHAADLQVNIVYNPLTVETLRQMRKRGGNALKIAVHDGPLTIVNINLRWGNAADTTLMTNFMRGLISRFQQAAHELNTLHPYIFQNHAFEDQAVFGGYGRENLQRLLRIREAVDPDGLFQVLQPGGFKLGIGSDDTETITEFSVKSEL